MSLRSVADSLPLTYTGADFYALCSDAMLKAVTRQATLVDTKIQHLNRTIRPSSSSRQGRQHQADGEAEERGMSTAYFFDHYAEPSDLAVVVTEADFHAARDELVPSVSQGELLHYEKVRAAFEGGGKGDTSAADGGGAGKSSKGKGRMLLPAAAGVDESGTVRRKSDKGKGKAVAGFQDGTASDDDGLY